MAIDPKESAEFIVQNAKYLKVNTSGIGTITEKILNGIKTGEVDINNFSQHDQHPNQSEPFAVDWIFLVDTLNFCFWTPENDTKWRVDNQTGYFALCAAINRAVKEGIDITNPAYYSKIDEATLSHILRSDDGVTKCPLIKERVECLHQVGERLIEKFDGKFENCVKSCNNSSVALLDLIVSEFPCFRDEAEFHGRTVSLYKRAQILIGDLWACFRGDGLGRFDDIEKVTMFADYRVPQVLVFFGALEYGKELLEVLESNTLLLNGSEMEVEIRGASIYIVEEVKKRVLAEITENYPELSKSNVNSILIDHFLWDYRRHFAKELEIIPFHKTISVYY